MPRLLTCNGDNAGYLIPISEIFDFYKTLKLLNNNYYFLVLSKSFNVKYIWDT